MGNFNLEFILQALPAILIGLVVHEYMHARVALACGDTTARDDGRITLNPLQHIDWLGFIFIIFAGFGWAKPVMINKYMLRNPKRDEMLIALAGPFSNLGLSIIFALLLKLTLWWFPGAEESVLNVFVKMLFYGVFINLGLFIFNLIPIPPLDGSHVLVNFFRLSDETVAVLYKYGTFLLFGILILESYAKIDILPIGKVIKWIAGWIFYILQI